MKKRIESINPGESFAYGGERFVVLERMDNGVFCLLEQSSKSVPFNSESDGPLNDYRKSTLRKEIEKVWLPQLIDNGASYDDFVPFDVELRPTDRSEGYGELLGVAAAPLTLWQYGKYKDIIPLNEEDWWWLVTPWACPWLCSPNTLNTSNAWYVYSGGGYGYNDCSSSYGIRPALKLNSDLLVSVDGDEEERAVGECDNYTVDLSRVDTSSLLKEIERRVVATTCDTQQGDCEARE